MTDIQSWRRNTQLARLLALGDVQASPPDSNALSTSPIDYGRLSAQPRRSLASFAGYFSAHRAPSANTTDQWPSFNWENPDRKDEVYQPDPDTMCSTLLRQVLANPSEELPAQYTNLIPHVIGAYYGLKREKESLDRKLREEEQSHRADVDEFHLAVLTWSTGGGSGPFDDDAHRMSSTTPAPDKDISYETLERDANHATKIPDIETHSPRKPWPNTRGIGSREEITETSNFLLCELPSELSEHSAITASRSNDVFRPRSPPPMSGASVTYLIGSNPECESSSEEEDHMTLTSIVDYSNKGRLYSQQFEHHNGHQAKGPASEDLDSRSRSANVKQQIERSSTAANSPPNLASALAALAFSSGPSRPKRLTNAAADETCCPTPSSQAIHKRGGRRDFPFSSGDDAVSSGQSNSFISPKHRFHSRASTKSTNIAGPPSNRDSSSELSRDRSPGVTMGSRPYPFLAKPAVSLTGWEQNAKPPERDGSSKRILTAIKEGHSSRSSSLSHQTSIDSNIGTGSTTDMRKQLGDNTFAIAAARAAKNGSSSNKTLRRQTSHDSTKR